mmetsp:Transcript_53966/g.145472  ORF Transcript_53966/g.145472 Transcript_53966/m.145472 type:complete len:216 (+) Transcript_53966:1380-2027(+)
MPSCRTHFMLPMQSESGSAVLHAHGWGHSVSGLSLSTCWKSSNVLIGVSPGYHSGCSHKPFVMAYPTASEHLSPSTAVWHGGFRVVVDFGVVASEVVGACSVVAFADFVVLFVDSVSSSGAVSSLADVVSASSFATSSLDDVVVFAELVVEVSSAATSLVVVASPAFGVQGIGQSRLGSLCKNAWNFSNESDFFRPGYHLSVCAIPSVIAQTTSS